MSAVSSPAVSQPALNPAAFDFPVFPSKASREKWLKGALVCDTRFALWALATIYQYQTEDEKQTEHTAHDNNVGFSGIDGEILSSFAKQYTAKGRLTANQFTKVLFKRIPAYAGQLIGVLESSGVVLPVVHKSPEPAPHVPPADASIDAVAKPAAKPGEPDWAVWRSIAKRPWAYGGPDKVVHAEWVAEVQKYIGKAGAFANDVWQTVQAKGYCTPNQAKVLAIACARAANGLPAEQTVTYKLGK